VDAEHVRIERGLIEAVASERRRTNRSVSEQLAHWARLGRAVESSLDPASPIGAVLAKEGDFDALDDEAQAAVTALWNVRMQEAIASLDLVAEFEASGEAYAYLDEDGNVVHVPRRGPRHVDRSGTSS